MLGSLLPVTRYPNLCLMRQTCLQNGSQVSQIWDTSHAGVDSWPLKHQKLLLSFSSDFVKEPKRETLKGSISSLLNNKFCFVRREGKRFNLVSLHWTTQTLHCFSLFVFAFNAACLLLLYKRFLFHIRHRINMVGYPFKAPRRLFSASCYEILKQ